MSTWAGQFGRGLVVVPAGSAKHFRFQPWPDHIVPYTKNLQFPHAWMVHWGCAHVHTGDTSGIRAEAWHDL